MQDLTGYSDDELSLVALNEEYFYNIRFRSNLKDILSEWFIFTDSQWDVLNQDIQDEIEEIQEIS